MAVVRDFINGQFGNDETEVVGIGGFTTVARVRESIRKTRDVPTTFLEDGSHVNDHIIRNPLVITIEGSVSDVILQPSPALAAFREAETQAGAITQYAPARTQAQVSKVSGIAADIQSAVDRVDAAVSTAQNFGRFVGLTGDEGKTNIEQFIDFVDAIDASDTLIRIDAPFRTYENMAVISVDYTRDNTTDSLTFTIEAQQFRFAETQFVEVAAPNPSANTNGQTQGEADKGAQEGEDVPSSFIQSFGNRIGLPNWESLF